MKNRFGYHNKDEELRWKKDKLLGRAWGYHYFEMGKNAVRECKKLVKLDPDDAKSFIELGFYREKNDEIGKAIKCYKKMMKRFPKNSDAYVNLGYIYEKHKRSSDMAMVCYEKALELNPSHEWALNNIGCIMQKEGKWKEALAYYKKAYEASGKANNQILHNLAWAYCRCKDYNRAETLYRILLGDKEYVHDSVYYDFGCLSYRVGNYTKAVEFFGKALSLCPGNRHLKRALNRAAKKAG